MNNYFYQILYTIILILVILLFRIITKKLISNRTLLFQFNIEREKSIHKVFNFIFWSLFLTIFGSIWGIDSSQLIMFITTLLTVLGVAFFAQWSHLSNITSGIILFFNSDIKIGDEILILDKEFNIQGKIEDIGVMFIKLKTNEDKIISIPNNVILQKPIQIISSL